MPLKDKGFREFDRTPRHGGVGSFYLRKVESSLDYGGFMGAHSARGEPAPHGVPATGAPRLALPPWLVLLRTPGARVPRFQTPAAAWQSSARRFPLPVPAPKSNARRYGACGGT